MPIISLKHRLIILFNPMCEEDKLQSIFGELHDSIDLYKHSTAAVVKKALENSGHNWSDFHVVGTIREPLSRTAHAFRQDLAFYRKRKPQITKFYRNKINKYLLHHNLRHFLSLEDMYYQDRTCLVDKIYRTDELEQLTSELNRKYGLNFCIEISESSNTELNTEILPSEELLRQKYPLDFRFFQNKLRYAKGKKLISIITKK